MRLEDIGKTVFLEVHFCEFSESDSKLRKKILPAAVGREQGVVRRVQGFPFGKPSS